MDDATGLCVGCLRTLDEIAAWSVLDDDARRGVLADVDARRTRQNTRSAAPAQEVPDAER